MKYLQADYEVQVKSQSVIKARKELDKSDKMLKDLNAEHGHLPVHAKTTQKKKMEKLRKRHNQLREQFFAIEEAVRKKDFDNFQDESTQRQFLNNTQG